LTEALLKGREEDKKHEEKKRHRFVRTARVSKARK
jgi:hypothetical protein